MATVHRNPPVPAVNNSASNAAAAQKKVLVTPLKNIGLERHMKVDKNVVDELLLVCGVIGTTTETSANGVENLVPVTDCLNWLQDLQRALRRDEDLYRPISLLLGNWNVVQKKLLPLVLTCRYDTPMVLTIVKILVILTKPLHENTVRAGRLVIDTKSKKVEEEVIEEQKKLRENALMQSKMLMEYKKAIVHHPSHRRNKNKDKDDSEEEEGGVLSVFVSLLAEPLSKTGTKRTDADHLTIELVLHLFRNILSAEPIVKGSQEAATESAQLHNECISLFERELVLEILLVICQEMELRENAQYNLLMMELLHLLFKSQDPTGVARCMMQDNTSGETPEKENQKGKSTTKGNNNKGKSNPPPASNKPTNGLLRAHLARDKQQFRSGAPARHGNFGGTLMLKRQDGKHQYVSASAVMDRRPQGSAQAADLAGPKRRRNKKTEPFIGSGRTLLAHTAAGKLQNARRGPAAQRAQKTLHRFCQRFLDKCYGPVTKSLKNEFRRDSVRLDGEQDQVIFFRIIWFFFQWFRVSGKTPQQQAAKEKKDGETEGSSSALGQLIFTMDVYTFNLVLNAATTFSDKKRYTRLAQTVALYGEMMHMLHSMYQSEDSTEQLMALGLMDRLFYNSDPVDHLPQLLSKWKPGTTSREYVCDLVELCHMTLKLLDANQKACINIRESEEALKATVQVKGSKSKKTKIQTNDAVLQMKLAASEFDVTSYFTRKIVGNQVVFLYTKLLEQYEFNAPHVNHRIVAFFLRLAKIKIVEGEDKPQCSLQLGDDGRDSVMNLLAPKTTTLEPMLYNIPIMIVLNKILNDPIIAKDQTYATLRSWAAGIVHNFANQAAANPALFVECLFKHPLPHRFCEATTNHYVTEELRMIAEKELLLEAQRLEMLNNDQSEEEDDEPEDEELEFVGTEVEEVKSNSKRRNSDASDDSSEEEASKLPKKKKKKRRLQSKKSKKTPPTPESDSSELEFESAPGNNDARGKTKNKISTKRKALDSSDEDSDSIGSPAKSKTKKGKPLSRKPNFEESSDEEPETAPKRKEAASGPASEMKNDSSDEEKEDKEKAGSPKRKAAATGSLDSSSDEEDDKEEKARKAKRSEEAKKMQNAVLKDSDSSSEED